MLEAGPSSGGPGSSGQQISVGYVPDNDLPQQPSLKAQGYRLVPDYPFGFDYFEPNFNNPKVGPILRQLYFRQAFQHLVDQTGWIHAYYDGLGRAHLQPGPGQPGQPLLRRQRVGEPLPVQRAGRESPARRARLEDRPGRGHHVRQAGDTGR